MRTLTLFTAFAIFSFALSLSARANEHAEQVKRGEYVLTIGGCVSCHTNEKAKGKPLAGGVPIKTPFGTFFTPNITPDKETGIGGWSDDEFIQAMTKGMAPDGSHYFPAFPYTSYTKISRQDLLDLKAYLDTVSPVNAKVQEHDVPFPFNVRAGMAIWKFLFFENAGFKPDRRKSEEWNRGAYLVNGPSHCVECHTPRNLLGGVKTDQMLAGEPNSPEGEKIPSLLTTDGSPFAKWSLSDTVFGLQTGMTPKGDFLGGSMGKVIANTTGKMTEADLKAIAVYLGKTK
jgi:mono/diheme cytochrome c family protein